MPIENNKRQAQRALVVRILEGDGRASRERRLSAFKNEGTDEPLRALVNKVATEPARISDADVAAVKAAGIGEDEVFELVICAAVGAATRQYETALGALAAAAAGAAGD